MVYFKTTLLGIALKLLASELIGFFTDQMTLFFFISRGEITLSSLMNFFNGTHHR